MNCFQYPIDNKLLLRKKKRIKKVLLDSKERFIEKRIAVLGGSTTNEIVDQLELFLLNYGIKPVFYQSDYAHYWQDAVFGNDDLDQFSPDIFYIHTNWRNISSLPTAVNSREEVERLLNEEYERFVLMWDKLAEKYGCPVIQNNFDRPGWRLFGNRDIYDYRGKSNFIFRLNQKFYDYADCHKGFYINDLDYLAASYGLNEWDNPLYWHMYKYCLCLDAIPFLAKSIADIIKSIYGKNKKVMVCDLDNTLWGGVVGDDGVEGIQVGPEVPMGQVYAEFQKYIKELKTIGVILAVNSKNDVENALAGLNHPDCPLKPDDFVSIKANWENKDINMRAIAAELNLGSDSFVFVDDNPTEREIIKKSDLGVTTPELDRVENYLMTIDHGGYFEVTTLSEDDFGRSEMYKANAQRNKLEKSTESYEEFLKSLKMKAVVRSFEPIYIQRIAQLTNKSNQFNLTTLRCSESDIIGMMNSHSFICLYGKLEDKFGDNGVVSVIAGEIIGKELHMRLWLMSCRVLKRGMEDVMLDTLVKKAKEHKLKKIIGYYFPTPKNRMVQTFYGRMGFEIVGSDEQGNTKWLLDINSYKTRNCLINIF